MDKKISIIVPAYNIQAYLGKTLDSLLAQTVEDMEIVVVNDGSRDGTGELAESYAARDGRIRVIHKENGGVTSARLRGVEAASGAYIGFVDGDDYVEPQMYARLLALAEQHQADIAHCGYQMVFPDGHVDYYYNTGKCLVQQGKLGCSDLLRGEFVEPALWNKLYRRELFSGLAERMDSAIRINEDLLMNFYLFRGASLAVFEDVCMYHYVLRPGSAATGKADEQKMQDPMKVLHIMERETAQETQWNEIVKSRIAYLLLNRASGRIGDQPDMLKPIRQEARRELRHRIPQIMKLSCSAKIKVSALWVAVWPWSYGMIHRIYARATGIDKKYSLD